MMVMMMKKMKRKGQRTKDEGNVADKKRGGKGGSWSMFGSRVETMCSPGDRERRAADVVRIGLAPEEGLLAHLRTTDGSRICPGPVPYLWCTKTSKRYPPPYRYQKKKKKKNIRPTFNFSKEEHTHTHTQGRWRKIADQKGGGGSSYFEPVYRAFM